MSESDVIDLMRRNPRRWFTSREIALLISTPDAVVRDDLAGLTRFRVITKDFQNGQNKWRWASD
jgi:hypothetical protein